MSRLTYEQVKQYVELNNKSSSFSTELVISIIWKESSFDPSAHARGSTATGLMQMTVGAVSDVNANTPNGVHFEHSDMSDAVKCIQCGTYYLQILYGRNGTVKKALEKYGTGPGYADNLLTCEGCIKKNPGNWQTCLNQIHSLQLLPPIERRSSMKIQEVINKALNDEAFAMELKLKAMKAGKTGYGSKEWADLMMYFADGPDSLAKLTADPSTLSWGPTTTTTVTTTTTGGCTTTTTTTTTTTN